MTAKTIHTTVITALIARKGTTVLSEIAEATDIYDQSGKTRMVIIISKKLSSTTSVVP